MEAESETDQFGSPFKDTWIASFGRQCIILTSIWMFESYWYFSKVHLKDV